MAKTDGVPLVCLVLDPGSGLEVNAYELLVLAVYTKFGDPDGTNIYPAVQTVANICHRSERWVQGHLHNLRIKGLLIADGSGPHGVDRYRLPMLNGKIAPDPSAYVPHKCSRKGEADCTLGEAGKVKRTAPLSGQRVKRTVSKDAAGFTQPFRTNQDHSLIQPTLRFQRPAHRTGRSVRTTTNKGKNTEVGRGARFLQFSQRARPARARSVDQNWCPGPTEILVSSSGVAPSFLPVNLPDRCFFNRLQSGTFQMVASAFRKGCNN